MFCDWPAKEHRNVCCVREREGMQESLLSRESPTSVYLNNLYPPRQGMSGGFMLSQYFSMTCSIIYSGLPFQFAMP